MTNSVHEFPAEARSSVPVISETRPLYWSIRRELWENRSIYIAPLIIASFVMLSFFFSTFSLARRIRTLDTLTPDKQEHYLFMPYSAGAAAILMTGFIVGMFYCADALYGERRDRSLLFWKSLPVSDKTVVLSKIAVPMVVIPLVTFTIALLMQIVMFALSTGILLVNGVSPGPLWSRVPLPKMTVIMIYGLTVHALWFAPLYAWVLLLSAWAKRAVLLWVILPPMTLFVMEYMLFRSQNLVGVLRYRLLGGMGAGFTGTKPNAPITKFSQLDPIGFVTTPGLWLGLLFAALCVAAAIRLRRNREPI